ncbi:MAG: hypothetical protein COW33_02685 [Anaerolineae bacterium CG17_big_fil_post_rev_8_21_14_2_50_57_27]|nr:MAG: hypothetical protein AUK02_03540 [Anaerolineae bacterium CG2_30_58_95]PIW20304.1 MAG: hypothetical protein COW33_02685 [Anaerolineae bacterium CG17_big_fil_post_rev_8_21_14_2_50_57_27]
MFCQFGANVAALLLHAAGADGLTWQRKGDEGGAAIRKAPERIAAISQFFKPKVEGRRLHDAISVEGFSPPPQ